MTTLQDFAGQCAVFAVELAKAQKAAAAKAAQGLTDRVNANTRSVAASGVLSGVGKRGAKVGAKTEPLRIGSAIVKATGPYQLIERDTSAHREPRAARRRGRALLIPGIGYRQSVHHPGTKGKHPFEKAVNQYGPQVPRVFQAEVRSAMGRSFR